MKKVGIIRCQSYSNQCSAAACFQAAKAGGGQFRQPVEIVAMDTCGGCPRGDATELVRRAQRHIAAGAEQIHLSNCLIGACPWVGMWEEALSNQVDVSVARGTH